MQEWMELRKRYLVHNCVELQASQVFITGWFSSAAVSTHVSTYVSTHVPSIPEDFSCQEGFPRFFYITHRTVTTRLAAHIKVKHFLTESRWMCANFLLVPQFDDSEALPQVPESQEWKHLNERNPCR